MISYSCYLIITDGKINSVNIKTLKMLEKSYLLNKLQSRFLRATITTTEFLIQH